MMSRLVLAILVASTALGATPALANEFCDKELTPIVQQRKALQDKLASISKRANKEGARDQFCGTLNAYIGNIRKFVTYIEANKDFCGVPDQAIDEAKKGLAQNQSLRRKVCLASAQPQAQQTPGRPALPKPPVELRLR